MRGFLQDHAVVPVRTRLTQPNTSTTARKVAVYVVGAIRGFREVLPNFVEMLQEPCAADVFGYLHLRVGGGDNATVTELRKHAWAKHIEAIFYTQSVKDSIISENPQYKLMRKFDTYERPYKDRSSANRLAMWRAVYICNQLRIQYEEDRGIRYTHVVRTRPDIVYGLPFPDMGGLDVATRFYFSSDGLVVGGPRAMDVFSSVYPNMSRLFRADPSRLGGSYVSERLAKDNFASAATQQFTWVELSLCVHFHRTGSTDNQSLADDALDHDELGGRETIGQPVPA